jgi:hypothetical protein
MIARTPGLSIVAVCALAIGIPVGLAPMHAVDALERSLPGDPGGRIRTLCYWRDAVHEQASAGDYFLWRTSLRSFSALAAYRPTTVNIETGGGAPDTGHRNDRLDLRDPADARDVRPRAERRRRNTRRAWTSSSSDTICGARGSGATRRSSAVPLTIGGAPFSIVGVMPPAFRFPTSHQLWMPLRMSDDGGGPRSGVTLVVFGRLSDGASPDAAQAELQALTSSLASRDPKAFERLRPAVLPAWHLTFGFPTPGGLRALPEFSLVQVLMLAPLLVACVNVGLPDPRADVHSLRRSSPCGRRSGRAAAASSRRSSSSSWCWPSWRRRRTADPRLASPRALLTAAGDHAARTGSTTGLTAATVLRGLLLAAGCAVIAGVAPALRMTAGPSTRTSSARRASRSGHSPGRLVERAHRARCRLSR